MATGGFLVTRSLVLFAFCALAAAQTPAPSSRPAAPAPADWRFAHPDADMKIGLNLQAVLNSDAFKKGMEQAKAQSAKSGGAANVAQIDMVLGMLRTVDRISVSARQNAPNDMDVLAEVTGSFDPSFITALFPSTGKNQVKVVADHTILIGEGDSFTRALSRINGPAKADLGGDLEQSDLWIQANAALLQQQAGQQQQQALPMLKDVKTFAVGLTFADAPVINMVLTSASDAGAATMLTTLQAMLPLLTTSPQSAALAKNLKLSQDGSALRMRMVIPPEMVAMLQQQALSAAGDGGLPAQLAPLLGSIGLGASPAKKAPDTTPVPPAQNGGSIKIYGLDGGPREIPIQK